MADINKELEEILHARYGRDVRQAIHDGMKAVNAEVDGNGSVNDEFLQNHAIGINGYTYEKLISEKVITFYTNWSDDTRFPGAYGSGLLIPCLDSNLKILTFQNTKGAWVKTISSVTTEPLSDWKSVTEGVGVDMPFLPNNNGVVKLAQEHGITDANDIITTSMYNAVLSNTANLPEDAWGFIFTYMHGDASTTNYRSQLWLGMTSNHLYFRNRTGGGWSDWEEVGSGGDIPIATPTQNGLMSADDKTKIDLLDVGYTKEYPFTITASEEWVNGGACSARVKDGNLFFVMNLSMTQKLSDWSSVTIGRLQGWDLGRIDYSEWGIILGNLAGAYSYVTITAEGDVVLTTHDASRTQWWCYANVIWPVSNRSKVSGGKVLAFEGTDKNANETWKINLTEGNAPVTIDIAIVDDNSGTIYNLYEGIAYLGKGMANISANTSTITSTRGSIAADGKSIVFSKKAPYVCKCWITGDGWTVEKV